MLQPDIDAAIKSAKRSINIANARRKRHSMMQTLKHVSQKVDYTAYTDGKCYMFVPTAFVV